jgi:tetratricopeptide (TPR) repeat protein
MAPQHEFYEVLQVSPNAELEVIQAAYKRLSLKWHPDRRPGDHAAAEKMKLLNEAYAALSDEQKRRDYDSRRKFERAAASPSSAYETPTQPSPERTQEAARTRPAMKSTPVRDIPQGALLVVWLVILVSLGLVVAGLVSVIAPNNSRGGSTNTVKYSPVVSVDTPRDRVPIQKASGADARPRRAFSSMLDNDPNLCRGMECLNNNDHDAAIKCFEQVITRFPKEAEGYIWRGTAWSEKHCYGWALDDFTEAIRLSPQDGFGYYLRGNAWLAKERLDEAARDFGTAVNLEPNNAEFRVCRDQALSALGQLQPKSWLR